VSINIWRISTPPSIALALLLLAGCGSTVKNGMGTEMEDSIASPYSQWRNGPPTDPSFFPIGVWLQDPRNAERYQRIGINTYVGLWQGPTPDQLTSLDTAGMKVICAQNEVGLAHLDDPTIIAWMHGDEPDNAQRQADGSWGGPVPTAKIIADYETIRSNDPTRPVWLNLGQGVANDEWVGRAAAYEDYPDYIKGADIASFDVYPVVGIRKPDGEQYLWYVARGVDRLLEWADYAKPVWNVIETTRINNPDKKATPHQVRAEVWMSLIHGSLGIVYFAHEWEPKFVEAGLLADAEMSAAVAAVNHQILALAPVLNSPDVADAVEVSSSASHVPVDALVKHYRGDTYIFAVGMRLGAAQATFQVAGLEGETRLEVIDEGREIAVVDGEFIDDFAPYEVHLYRIAGD